MTPAAPHDTKEHRREPIKRYKLIHVLKWLEAQLLLQGYQFDTAAEAFAHRSASSLFEANMINLNYEGAVIRRIKRLRTYGVHYALESEDDLWFEKLCDLAGISASESANEDAACTPTM